MKKIDWLLIVLVLIGFMIGGFLGSFFDSSFLNFGESFGLTSPIELDLGFIALTFGLQVHITVASVIGCIISFVVYRFIR